MIDLKKGDLVHFEVNEGGRIAFEALYSHYLDYEELAVDMAEHYHHRYDGWEASWPVDMKIYKYSEEDDGDQLWSGEVDREAIPYFSARTAK